MKGAYGALDRGGLLCKLKGMLAEETSPDVFNGIFLSRAALRFLALAIS